MIVLKAIWRIISWLQDPFLDRFVTHQLQSGKYQNYDELVEEALCLLQEREAVLDRIAEKLRPTMEEFHNGHQGFEFDVEDIVTRGMERLAASG